jgi:hypothetical protein
MKYILFDVMSVDKNNMKKYKEVITDMRIIYQKYIVIKL